MHLKLGEVSVIGYLAREVFKTYDIVFAERPRFFSPPILTNCGYKDGIHQYGVLTVGKFRN